MANAKDIFSKIKDIKPEVPPSPSNRQDDGIRRIAEDKGFVDDIKKVVVQDSDTVDRVYKRKPGEKQEPKITATMRVLKSDWNDFVTWCNENRYSYHEGFNFLMKNIKP